MRITGRDVAKFVRNAVSRSAREIGAGANDLLTSSRDAVDDCFEPGESNPANTLPSVEHAPADKSYTRAPSSPFLPSVAALALGTGVFSVQNWPAVLQVPVGVLFLIFGIVHFAQAAHSHIGNGWRSAGDAKFPGAPLVYFDQVAKAVRFAAYGLFNLVFATFLESTEFPLGTLASAFEHGIGFSALAGLACMTNAIALLCGPALYYVSRYTGKAYARVVKLMASSASEDDVSGPDI